MRNFLLGSILVASNCFAQVAVQVAAPLANSTVTSPIHIQATASSSHPIVGWHIYLDNSNLYSAASVKTIDTTLKASAGSHRIVIRAWDSTGAYGDQTLQAKVGTPTPTPPPTPTPIPPPVPNPVPPNPPPSSGVTTLAAEISNNTSASSSFPGWNDGNMKPGNVSKVDVHKLLYAGATTKVYAHLMIWWGFAGHKSIGYTSWDQAQVTAQINDMISRGINGAIIDYYGPARTTEEQGVQMIFREAEKHPGFEVAIDLDKGAIDTSNVTGSTVSQLNHIRTTFETSPAYMRKQGRPVVHFFGVESLGVTWSTVQAQVSGNPIYVFENSGGFTSAASVGAFSWVGHLADPNDWGQSYLDSFYRTALTHPGEYTFGSAKKGFNDTMASWTKNRIVNQNCGRTWLNTFKEIGTFYSQTNQLESLQLVTWNDYEEGSEIESGIDNCINVAQPSVSGSTLSWGVQMTNSQATMDTIDHFTVYASQDGAKLTAVADLPNTETSLDLSKYTLASGAKFYVKAVGLSSIANHMSQESK